MRRISKKLRCHGARVSTRPSRVTWSPSSTIVWSDQPSEVRIQTDGQLSLGVIVEKPDGQSVEVGASIACMLMKG